MTDLSINYFILWFLNYKNLPISDSCILKLSYIYNVPSILFYKKFLQRNYKEGEQIHYYLVKLQNVDYISKELLEDPHFISELEKLLIYTKNCAFIEYNQDALQLSYKYLTKLKYIFNNDSSKDILHVGQPLPDPNNGRPYINWKICKYEGCGKIFYNEDSLIKHLENNNCYTPRFHKIHEEIVYFNGLTPDKIIEKNLKNCPAYICKNNNFNNPEDLIKHFKILGIPPFWKQGDEIETSNKIKINYELKGNLFDTEDCVICFENKTDLICDPCLHKVYCNECYNINYIKKCPICRENILRVYPFI